MKTSASQACSGSPRPKRRDADGQRGSCRGCEVIHPRRLGGSVAEGMIWLLLAGPVMIWASNAAWRRLRDRRKPLRPGLPTLGGSPFLVTAYVFWRGVNLRLVQAACWRGGVDAVSDDWKPYCRRIPPQGVDGYCSVGWFGRR